ncbi:exonuclease, DNA polymerase III, epsilon subunit family [Ferrithrix thermotolerans DSM 19514]|uniref:Exonuclease, DNA polymerase III, epsilon subunit family n=1 Tax=Ferrithrix thermotolerans DSM 19514 TaxID=1121881 RepID=A0A1M4UMY7_9ACTN|nr:exonuclease domain-containing protein [Ferrithrix thermotolerans]SHE58017.1 exonuclease, DNA polymerase III, epsilon subunit family [Ferrithrix thermotolerans DSM 19514]
MQLELDYELTQLSQLTFCVLDVETNGSGPEEPSITEIAAVKVRYGHLEDRFHTLMRPKNAIPPRIVALTGIQNHMVEEAPLENEVIPQFAEFVRGTVPVGHNVKFDLRYINAACVRIGMEPLTATPLDTLTLSRRLLLGEVHDFRLGTLSQYISARYRPSHRAMDDVLATVELLHALIERAGQLGATHLEDLRTITTLNSGQLAKKTTLSKTLPHKSGVYLFLDQESKPLYVGKATDLKTRVRSYFSSEQRRKIPVLLHQLSRIDYSVTPTLIEAEALERRLIQGLAPRFNHQHKNQELWWIDTRHRSLLPSSAAKDHLLARPNHLLGPFLSKFSAHSALRAIESLKDSAGEVLLVDRDPEVYQRIYHIFHNKMVSMSNEKEFEKAAVTRDDAKRLLMKLSVTLLAREIRDREALQLLESQSHQRVTIQEGLLDIQGDSCWYQWANRSTDTELFESALVANRVLRGGLNPLTHLSDLSLASEIHRLGELFVARLS